VCQYHPLWVSILLERQRTMAVTVGVPTQLSPILTTPLHEGMARLSWISGWLLTRIADYVCTAAATTTNIKECIASMSPWSCFNASARPRYSLILSVMLGQMHPSCWALSNAWPASCNMWTLNHGLQLDKLSVKWTYTPADSSSCSLHGRLYTQYGRHTTCH